MTLDPRPAYLLPAATANWRKRAFPIALALGTLVSRRFCLAEVTIQVVSRPKLTAYAKCSGVECRVQGSLEDDLGLPLSGQALTAAIEDPTTERTGSRPSLKPCEQSVNPEPNDRTQDAVTRTDESGKFCFFAEAGTLSAEASVSIKFAGAGGYESVGFVVKLADSGSPTVLNVLNASNRIAIEAGLVTIAVQLSAKERQVAEQSISLLILDPALRETQNQEKILATAKTDADGIVHFAVAGARFGAPGPAELSARFTGTRDMSAAFVTWPVMKACTVHLRTTVESSDPEVGDLADITALVTSACGTVTEGSVEFFIDRAAQVALPVKQGRASWRLSTFQFRPGDISIGSRYVAASAAWSSDISSTTTLHLKPVSGKRRALWLASGCLILIWFAFRWRRGDSNRKSGSRQPATPMRPQSLEVEPSSSPEFGWVGVVIDSHTGKPIAEAAVAIVTPGFSGTRTELDVKSSAKGEFTLPHRDLPPRSLLVVTAPRYLRAQWSMPSAGKLVVRLETRRRAIIRAFLQWAHKTHSPSSLEPTPAEIARHARQQSRAAIDEWATKVEVAAFGPDDPSPSDEELTSPPEDAAFGHKRPQ